MISPVGVREKGRLATKDQALLLRGARFPMAPN